MSVALFKIEERLRNDTSVHACDNNHLKQRVSYLDGSLVGCLS